MEGNYGNYGNYSTTSYNSGGDAGAGGFMPGGSQTSPSGGSGFKNDSLRPVTIKQLMEAESSDGTEFKIDASPISQVTVVGQVRNISTQTTNITYRLDDGTGVVEVKVWIDPEAVDSNRPQITENTYVRAWGRLKAFSNKRHLGAHFIRPIQDPNEVNYHLLEATAVHLFFTKGPPGEGGKDGTTTNGAAVSGGDALPPGLSSHARAIWNVLKSTPSGNEGLHIQDIASRTGMEFADVAKGGDELLQAGVIYATVDDSTWQILDMGNGR